MSRLLISVQFSRPLQKLRYTSLQVQNLRPGASNPRFLGGGVQRILVRGTARRNFLVKVVGDREQALRLPPSISFDPPRAGWRSSVHVRRSFPYIVYFVVVPCIKSVLQTFQLDAKRDALHSPPLSPTISVHSRHSFPHHYLPQKSRHLPNNVRVYLTCTRQMVWSILEPRLAATKRHLGAGSIRARRKGIGHRVLRHLGRDSVSCVRARGRYRVSKRTLLCQLEVESPPGLRGWTKYLQHHRKE